MTKTRIANALDTHGDVFCKVDVCLTFLEGVTGVGASGTVAGQAVTKFPNIFRMLTFYTVKCNYKWIKEGEKFRTCC